MLVDVVRRRERPGARGLRSDRRRRDPGGTCRRGRGPSAPRRDRRRSPSASPKRAPGPDRSSKPFGSVAPACPGRGVAAPSSGRQLGGFAGQSSFAVAPVVPATRSWSRRRRSSGFRRLRPAAALAGPGDHRGAVEEERQRGVLLRPVQGRLRLRGGRSPGVLRLHLLQERDGQVGLLVLGDLPGPIEEAAGFLIIAKLLRAADRGTDAGGGLVFDGMAREKYR